MSQPDESPNSETRAGYQARRERWRDRTHKPLYCTVAFHEDIEELRKCIPKPEWVYGLVRVCLKDLLFNVGRGL